MIPCRKPTEVKFLSEVFKSNLNRLICCSSIACSCIVVFKGCLFKDSTLISKIFGRFNFRTNELSEKIIVRKFKCPNILVVRKFNCLANHNDRKFLWTRNEIPRAFGNLVF